MAIHHATLPLDILYDDAIAPSPATLSLENIAHDALTGDYSLHRTADTDKILSLDELRQACAAHGTDVEFFFSEEQDSAPHTERAEHESSPPPDSGAMTRKKPWERTQQDLLGRIDRVDPHAANWDEAGFQGSHPQYTQEGSVIHRSRDIHFGYLFGQPNEAHVKAHYEYAIGKGAGKDDGRYFLLAEIVADDGRTQHTGAIGEYAGTGNGMYASHRGYGAGKAFFKALMFRGIWTPEALGYSPGGLAAVKSAHKSLLTDALAAHKPVPADVLADYPDLNPATKATSWRRPT